MRNMQTSIPLTSDTYLANTKASGVDYSYVLTS